LFAPVPNAFSRMRSSILQRNRYDELKAFGAVKVRRRFLPWQKILPHAQDLAAI
jgi:hypothetical protein